MRLTLLQRDIEWVSPQANLARAEEAIARAQGSDLYVLPEMFATGFNVSADEIAEDARQSPTIGWMRRMADEHGAAIAGSVAVREADGSCRNRFVFARPGGGGIDFYDKRHLFTYGGEPRHYRRGEERVIVGWRGVRFLLHVCYDLRFPVWSRNGRLADADSLYDAILYVASWPASRMEVWRTLLRARAIENQCYVCGVNRVGSDPLCAYAGGTTLVDAYGNARECGDGETALTAELDLPRLRAFRSKFPVLADRD